MAKRKQLFHPDEVKCYVYSIEVDGVAVYVGKGSGGRANVSAKNHGGTSVILEEFSNDDDAFAAEIDWIKKLRPERNKTAGGNGSRVFQRSEFDIPKSLDGKVSKAQWRRDVLSQKKECRKMQQMGRGKYTALMLLKKIDRNNCSEYGVSEYSIERLEEIAHG